ncbi:MAG: bifunctional phosphoribosylaminoimidazolecarboxamide formyltransferase/IMP cyclohydrolase [Anaerolineae bacterium]|nr:bifunctional phosphoribosylaminoimidazolecarboxamide formyltransferase/IMP cyclohydrolase [Anaerolineae bacterium]
MAAPRALLSTYDRTGLADFARGLVALGYELVASGGTARALGAEGLPVTPVESLTGYPEMLGGRVKTLHPAIHGGILARRTPEHLAELAQHGLAPIDLVAVNLYPFSQTVARPGVTLAEAVEQIDIGGVALLRAAAKNFASVWVVCDPADYPQVLQSLQAGSSGDEMRRRLAEKAFRHTAAYDAAIAAYLARPADTFLPSQLALPLVKAQDLRYGENPHQQAALYRLAGSEPAFTQLQGKELSYNNLLDLDAAWGLVQEFSEPAVVIIKHTNPCGCATAGSLAEAYPLALAGDPVSAFGGIIAVNRELDAATVEAIGSLFVEVLVAPAYAAPALERLARKRDCRVMRATGTEAARWSLRAVADGILVQTPDVSAEAPQAWRVVTRQQPAPEQLRALSFAWRVCKHTKSNAITLARSEGVNYYLVGTGAGQMSRVDSVRLAVAKAGAERARGAVLASDAFFPFADGVEEAARAGVQAIVEPGGSKRDDEVIAAADAAGIALCFTGVRHFRH